MDYRQLAGRPPGMYSLVNLDVKTGELRIEKDIGDIDQAIDCKLWFLEIITERQEGRKVVTFPKKGVKVVNPLWFDFYND